MNLPGTSFTGLTAGCLLRVVDVVGGEVVVLVVEVLVVGSNVVVVVVVVVVVEVVEVVVVVGVERCVVGSKATGKYERSARS